jgi:hypothetical protein
MKTARDFPYKFLIPKIRNQWEADAWCTQQFGKRWSVVDNREGVWCCFWRGRAMSGSYEWYFLNEQDAMMFALRWA